MPALSFAPTLRAAVKGADAVVVVAPQSVLTGSGCPSILDTPVQELLVELARLVKPGDIGAVGSTLTGTAPRRLYAAVLPDRVSRGNTPTRAESIRRVIPAGDLGQYKRAALILVLDDASHYVAAANAIARAFPDFSMKSGPGSDLAVAIVAIDRQGNFIKASPRVGETMNTTRAVSALVDTPPTDLNPEAYAREARRILGGLKGVKIKEIVGDALLKNKLGGIHAVGRTALSAPRMLVATYTPAKAKRHIALVGKGVTYDTGGLNLKVGGVMSNMKCDMAGSAALLGAFRVLVAGGCKHQLSLILCMAENAIGPNSYKPDDILTLHSGKTVEINNTDAEGRLLLADGVSCAARVLKADTVIDAATLTGAQMIATGLLHAVIVSNDDDLERTFVSAGRVSGDLVVPLPFAPEFFKAEFESPVADMCNSVRSRTNAPSACAAQFVHWQIEDTSARWLHIDLAGPAFPKNRATGFGVALVSQAVDDL